MKAQADRPKTLLGHVALVVVGTFAVVSGLLLALNYLEFKQGMAARPGLRIVGQALAATLAAISDEQRARWVLLATAEQFNHVRHDDGLLSGDLLFRLDQRAGGLVEASAAWAASAVPLPAPALAQDGPLPVLKLSGTDHWVYVVDAGPWRLAMAEPYVDDSTVLVWLVRELGASLLLAFPLILLPVYLALRQGLRPLTRLAGQLRSRPAADLSPLGESPRHAELQVLVQAFDVLLARLRRQLEHERAFVQDAAHELRTPMAVIAAQAHVLAHAGDAVDRAQAHVALSAALERASRLSGQLLALAAMDRQAPVDRQATDLAELVQQSLVQAAPRAIARGLDISLDAPDHLVAAVDRAAFQSVLSNLLDNACRYVPTGGRIAVALAGSGDGFELRVADDGAGLTAAERARAFDRFWRAPGQTLPGSGLGLSIVCQAARRLGGQVNIEDGLGGRGITVVLRVSAGG